MDQEKASLLRKLKGRVAVTADQVVGARHLEAENEAEELRRRNAELERDLLSVRYTTRSHTLCRRSFCRIDISSKRGTKGYHTHPNEFN